MNISGWAFSSNGKEESARRYERFKEIAEMDGITITRKSPQYARTSYAGTLDTDEAKALSEEDILIYCDGGNTCFGGTVYKSSNSFQAEVYTD